jgi:CspA family cold shock protein
MIGKVLWFDVKKGFGFIRCEEDGSDVFVHYSKIQAEPGEFRLLEANENVEFEKFDADRGGADRKPQAKNVRKVP